jgi:hypothetical protein
MGRGTHCQRTSAEARNPGISANRTEVFYMGNICWARLRDLSMLGTLSLTGIGGFDTDLGSRPPMPQAAALFGRQRAGDPPDQYR